MPVNIRFPNLTLFDFNKNKSWIDNIALVSQVGLTMAGSIVFCLAIGYFLDKWLGIRGLFSIIFILLGIAGGGYTAYRQIEKVVDIKGKGPSYKKKNGRS
ncbi:MAG TPA: AtpZ/AtpI family protein [Desulfobacteraceae bacterium]|nr:AtpZ/AtpI family protein [Desulfobacteraceae bacterium]HPQ27048.1 AtpZ/AtpI family protein [Desulfobacteraceae bacterium]